LDEFTGNTAISIRELQQPVSTRKLRTEKSEFTDAIALFSGELDFSSTIDEIDSTDETRE
jgi:hypothetical protein